MPKPLDKELKPFLERIESVKADIEKIRDTGRSEIGELNESIREIYAEVKGKGLPVGALKATIKWRKLEAQQDELITDAESELLIEQLGPLGRAAAKRFRKDDGDDDDPRPQSLKDSEASRKDEGELSGVGRGKPAPVH